jgi:pimeloyl-ACP methyl ester carboxylesterase
MPDLAQDWQVFAVDLRGHGLSEHLPGTYRVQDYARDVAAFLREVVARPAVLVGHSLGGLVAVCVATKERADICGLFLEDPPIYSAGMPALRETLAYSVFVAWRDILEAHAKVGGTARDLAPKLVGTVDAGRLDARTEQLHQVDPDVLEAALQGTMYDGFEPDRLLPEVRCATHLLAAGHARGGAMRATEIERVVSAIPDCTCTLWSSVGHDIHHSWTGEYLQELRCFLEKRREGCLS